MKGIVLPEEKGHEKRPRIQLPPLRLKPIPDHGKAGVPKAPQPKLTKKVVVKAVSHRVRVHALIVLSERLASPTTVAKELGLTTEDVAYHFRILEKLDLIELEEVRRSKGGRLEGKFYRGKVLPYFDIEGWKQMDASEKPAITAGILAMCANDINQAIAADTLDAEDNHISRTVMLLDQPRYEQLLELLLNTLNSMLQLKAEAAQAIRAGAEPVPTKVHIIQFEAPGATEIELADLDLPEEEAS